MREPMKTVEVFVFGWVVFILAVALLALAPFTQKLGEWLLPQGRTWHDLATAVGTVGATVAALYFGLSTRREQQGEKVERARLVASDISESLVANTAKLSRTLDVLVMTCGDGHHLDDVLADLKMLPSELSKVGFIDRPTLEALIPLPHNVARRIARAQDLLRVLVAHAESQVQFLKSSDGMLKRAHLSSLNRLSRIVSEFEMAARAVAAAAELPPIPPVNSEDQ